jgi:hypothetical protein
MSICLTKTVISDGDWNRAIAPPQTETTIVHSVQNADDQSTNFHQINTIRTSAFGFSGQLVRGRLSSAHRRDFARVSPVSREFIERYCCGH